MGNLDTNKVYAWTADDHKISDVFQSYYANFVKTFDPNGPGLPKWPAVKTGDVQVLTIDVVTKAAPEAHRDRFLFVDQLSSAPAASR
jgi:para-nitrobenzyl esterase